MRPRAHWQRSDASSYNAACAGEIIQRTLPGARVVKAFNTTGERHRCLHSLSYAFASPVSTGTLRSGSHTFYRPACEGGLWPDMFICGNDDAAKGWVRDLLASWHWGTVDLGGIESARYTEPMCLAWCIVGFRGGGWGHTWKLLRPAAAAGGGGDSS